LKRTQRARRSGAPFAVYFGYDGMEVGQIDRALTALAERMPRLAG